MSKTPLQAAQALVEEVLDTIIKDGIHYSSSLGAYGLTSSFAELYGSGLITYVAPRASVKPLRYGTSSKDRKKIGEIRKNVDFTQIAKGWEVVKTLPPKHDRDGFPADSLIKDIKEELGLLLRRLSLPNEDPAYFHDDNHIYIHVRPTQMEAFLKAGGMKI